LTPMNKDPLLHDEPTVFILDSDREACRDLKAQVRHLHLHAESYGSAAEFFEACDPRQRGCLLLDAHLPGMHGPAALRRLADRGIHLPVIVLCAKPEVSAAVRAIKAGALNYLEKPCDGDDLADAILEAIAWDAGNREWLAHRAKIARRLARLTPGESRVLELLVEGKSNKAIAAELGIHVRTVEVRRAKLMKKMRARSLAELVRATVSVGFGSPLSRIPV